MPRSTIISSIITASVSLFFRVFGRVKWDWKRYTFIKERASRIPGTAIEYGLQDADRCICCGGFLLLVVLGHVVDDFCHRGKTGHLYQCLHHDAEKMMCSLPGYTCRDTPDNKFTTKIKHNHRLWVAFKAFKVMQVAWQRGWCEYHDTNDFQIVVHLARQSGLKTIWIKDGDADRFEWIGRPGVFFPGKYNHCSVFADHREPIDAQWAGDPLIDAFARMARRISWGKKEIYPLPGFISYMNFS